MATNKITDGVGKKIVDALKAQSDIEIQNIVESPVEEDETLNENVVETTQTEEPEENDITINTEYSTPISFVQPQLVMNESFASELDSFEVPNNVAVLKQLITQLPAGVSKQTGALIIKQTMEALGISMKSVLQEAQQIQEGLNNSSKECQASIAEYKKQISMLEKQSQKYQKQYAALNDIISLFIQTNF